MPTSFVKGYGSGNVGGGYGTLRNPQRGADSKAEEVWPYASRSRYEVEAEREPDEEEGDREAIAKKNKKQVAVDRLQQLNYHPNSFVNGQTRGLTGIMSGMDPQRILEQFIVLEAGLDVKAMRRSRYRGMGGAKPVGLGAPNPNTMSSDPTTRTRSGMTLGSKSGWFSPPPPKESDPSMSDHAYSLKDIADKQDTRSLRNARIEQRKIRKKSRVEEMKNAVLRSYVGFVASEKLL